MVSNFGNVKNVQTGLTIKPYLTGRGYYYVRFYKRGGGAKGADFLISRLVAELWICRALNRTNNVYANIHFSYLDYNAVDYDPQFYHRIPTSLRLPVTQEENVCRTNTNKKC